jgi:hypothetical protein
MTQPPNIEPTSATLPHPRALSFLSAVVRSTLPDATVQFLRPSAMIVTVRGRQFPISLWRSHLDDLERAMDEGLGVPYLNGLKRDAEFDLYRVLGNEGLLPQGFKLSEFLLKELRRDWTRQCSLHAQFQPEVAKGLYDGLKRLERSLGRSIDPEISIPEIEHELSTVRDLINFYDTHQNLNSADARIESLSYLKAAALVWIMDLENRMAAAPEPRLKAGYLKKMFAIAADFEVQPYNRIKLPPALADYVARERGAVDSSQRGLRQHADVESLLERLDPRLRDRWVGAWQALESDNADAVSQATNSMVEVLDKVIDRVAGPQEFRVYLEVCYPGQADMLAAMRQWIAKTKDGLHAVKHHTEAQPPQLAEDLMHAAEHIVKILLRE